MRADDPSLDKLQNYIRNYFPELRSAERGQAIFWFALHYNRGAGSELFKAVEAFAFSGVPLLPAPERGDPAWQPYQMLSVTYAPHRRPKDPNQPDRAEKQATSKAPKKRRTRAEHRAARQKLYDQLALIKPYNLRHLPVPMYLDPQFMFGWWTTGCVQGSAIP